ncbi:MAG: ABC transporter ATP-binding protein [Gammaproteobacteria bacterium]|nr:ABC transporter ATP-binding protein [Gammaproteobacteria bacterium]MYE82430.1 ABC transporter ATP-binding protein [Gammaproteobacteria bacterium]
MNALVEIRGLTRHFDLGRNQIVHAVDDVSLDIAPREIVGLVGESGSGKSTLGKTMLGLHDKTAGDVVYKGETLPQRYAPGDFQRFARSMQMIFQDPYSSLNPRMTVGEIVAEGLRLHTDLASREIRERVSDWLERVGLNAGHTSRYPHEFSGGQRQRIGIARALIMEPEFVVCDEPISALDVSVQAQVVNLLGELKESLGLTMLFIAHDLSMVRYISDRMAVMYLGSLIELGPANRVFFHPKHPYTEMLVGSNPEPDPATERNRPPTAIRGEIPSPVNVQPGCRFANRCPKVMDVCQGETPELRVVEDPGQGERIVACHLY